MVQDFHSTVQLFAGNTMIYLTVSNKRDTGLLQLDLSTLSQWADTSMMELHPQKCEVISITRKRKAMKYTYSLYGQELKHVESVKYLRETINTITSKATNSLNFLRRNIRASNSRVKQTAYIRPLLEYSQTIWDPYTAVATKKLEAVQQRATRFLTNRYRRTSCVTDMLVRMATLGGVTQNCTTHHGL